MSIKSLILLSTLLSLIGCSIYNLGKILSKSNQNKTIRNNTANNSRYFKKMKIIILNYILIEDVIIQMVFQILIEKILVI